MSTLVALLMAVLAIAWASIFVRWCGQVPASVIAFYRMFWSSVVLLATLLPGRAIRLPFWRGITAREALFVFFAGLMLAFHFVSWIAAVQQTTVAHALVLGSTHPIFTVLLAPYLVKEKGHWISYPAAFLTLLGVALVAGGDFFQASFRLRGDLLALLSALCMSIYVLIARRLRHQIPFQAYLLSVYALAALVLFLFNVFSRWPLWEYPLRSHFWMLMLALVPTGIGHSLINWAARRMAAHKVNFAILGEPVLATLLAYLIFSEIPSTLFYPGAGLILLGIALSLRS